MNIVTKELKRKLYFLLGICKADVTADCCRNRFVSHPAETKYVRDQLINDASDTELTLV
jgi:hypothetical protein